MHVTTNRWIFYLLLVVGLILIAYKIFVRVEPVRVGDMVMISEFDSLVWSDEFAGSGSVDTTKWFHQTQLPPGGSWWGGIIQHYTDRKENAYLKDGFLHVVAIKETFDDQGEIKQYTSARLNSKFTFTYGRVEVRAKLPEGVGTWPAIWMLSKNINENGAFWQKQGFGNTNWPDCGEMDIMEHWGKDQNYVSSAVHTASNYGNSTNHGGQRIENVSNQFHLYAIEWSEDKVIFSADNIVHYIYDPVIKNDRTWPFDSAYYFLMNIAIEREIDPTFIESAMVVDYIRVYQ